jgi:hypothetical protein
MRMVSQMFWAHRPWTASILAFLAIVEAATLVISARNNCGLGFALIAEVVSVVFSLGLSVLFTAGVAIALGNMFPRLAGAWCVIVLVLLSAIVASIPYAMSTVQMCTLSL